MRKNAAAAGASVSSLRRLARSPRRSALSNARMAPAKASTSPVRSLSLARLLSQMTALLHLQAAAWSSSLGKYGLRKAA